MARAMDKASKILGGSRSIKSNKLGLGSDGGEPVFHDREPEEQETKSQNDLSDVPVVPFLGEKFQGDADSDSRKGGLGQFKSDELGGHRRADIRPQSNPHSLLQGHQPGAHEAYEHDRRGRGGLDESGHPGSGQTPDDPVGGNGTEDFFDFWTGSHLQPFGHGLHAQEKKPQAADGLNQGVDDIHDSHCVRISVKR